MEKHDVFIDKLKLIYEKTKIKYVLVNLFINFSVTVLITVFFLWISTSFSNRTLSKNEIYFVITISSVAFLSFTMSELMFH